MPTTPPTASRLEILRVALKLGCTSFGGPAAHLGYFHAEYVLRRRWLSEAAYADLVALCQFLPGPASSQLGFAIGWLRGGWWGAVLAWMGFTLPSAVLMTLAGYGVAGWAGGGGRGWIEGLKLAAVAVVAQAVWTMAARLCAGWQRAAIMIAAAGTTLALPAFAWVQPTVLAVGALAGSRFLRTNPLPCAHLEAGAEAAAAPSPSRQGRGAALGALILFVALLVGLPAWRAATGNGTVAVCDAFYRAGALVFGGGHVVLPLLEAGTVAPGWVSADRFLAGYGLAQAVPGPLFTFAAYLGTVLRAPLPRGWGGALLCLGAIYLPSGLLVAGVLPFWDALRRRPWAQAALRGANAAVVGLLVAALYRPVWTTAVHGPIDLAVALVALGLLTLGRCPPWLVVGLAAWGRALL